MNPLRTESNGNRRRIDDSQVVVLTPGMSIQQAIALLKRRGGLKQETKTRRYSQDREGAK